MSMIDKIKARNREAFEPLFSDNSIGLTISNNNEYTRDNVPEYCDTIQEHRYQLQRETENTTV